MTFESRLMTFGLNELNYQVELDTPDYNMSHMDSLYSDANQMQYRIKIAFPFVWASDLNSNNVLEFSEFQKVRPWYDVEERISFAVNFECSDSLQSEIYLNLKILEYNTGELMLWMRQKINCLDSKNNLAYFFLSPEDSDLNAKSGVSLEKKLDSSLVSGLYIYQTYLEDSNSNNKLGGYFDSLMIINFKDTIVPFDSSQLYISNVDDLKKHRSKQISDLEADASLSKKEVKKKKKAIKKSYKSGKKSLKKGEQVLKKVEGVL